MTVIRGKTGWIMGDVATFAKLHYETFERTERNVPSRKDRGTEVDQFRIEGKYRPCLILEVRDDHYRIWWRDRPS